MSHAEEYYMYGKDVLGKGLKPKPQVGGEGTVRLFQDILHGCN